MRRSGTKERYRLTRKSGGPVLLAAALFAGLSGCAATSDTRLETAEGEALAVPVFQEIAASAGLSHSFRADSDFVVGGGASAFDCDGDGDLDVAVAGGLAPMALFVNRTSPGGSPAFDTDQRFSAVLGDRADRVTGVYAVDIDNDGAVDLVATRFGRNLVLRNAGDCRFEDVTARWGLSGTGVWTTAFAAAWVGQDAYPTLIFANYVRRDRPLEKRGNCEPTLVVRPDTVPSGGSPRYGPPVAIRPSHCALSVRQVDWRGSGADGETVDFWIANDREYADPEGQEQLLSLRTDELRLYTEADGWVRHRIWGMGVAAADVDGDGAVEVAVTNMAENRFFTRVDPDSDRPGFRNEAWPRGAAAQRPHTGGDPRPSTSWHTAFADFNNDARLDLLIVKGNVDAMPQFAAFDPDSLLLGVGDGRFSEAGAEAGIGIDTVGRGAAVFDGDGDGCLDILVVNRNAPVSFFHAMCKSDRPSVDVTLRQDGANTFAVGARVSIDLEGLRSRRSVVVGGGHAGSSLTPVHIGAPGGIAVSVRVTWPDGSQSGPVPVQAGASYIWHRGEDRPRLATLHNGTGS